MVRTIFAMVLARIVSRLVGGAAELAVVLLSALMWVLMWVLVAGIPAIRRWLIRLFRPCHHQESSALGRARRTAACPTNSLRHPSYPGLLR